MKFNLRAFTTLVRQIAPIVLAAVPNGQKLGPVINTITAAIEEAEQIPGATGAEKKDHVLKITAAGVAVANAAGAKLNDAEIAAIAGNGIDAVVGAVNAVKKEHVAPAPASSSSSPADPSSGD